MSQFEIFRFWRTRHTSKPSFPLDFDSQIAGRAPEKIVLRIRRDSVKADYGSVVDPASRAVMHASARRLVIGKALESELRSLKFILYLFLARSYLVKFGLKLCRIGAIGSHHLCVMRFHKPELDELRELRRRFQEQQQEQGPPTPPS